MCGIAGWWSTDNATGDQDSSRAVALAMGQALRHRGPDSDGIWQAPVRSLRQSLWLVHRRLAIQDLSDAGHQPMSCHASRYHIVYNGELYNHQAIRHELSAAGLAPEWRGHSDTETLLAAMNAWGIDGALTRCNGMFAFAVYDSEQRSLSFARDRLGEKPLYIGQFGNSVVFGSELNALRAHPAFVAEINSQALSQYFTRVTVPAPASIYDGIIKLCPGQRLTVVQPDAPLPEPVLFWSATHIAEHGARNPLSGSDAELTDALAEKLSRAVQSRMIADVPLGAFLSGGFDSSLVVALMQQSSSQPVRTFTIGFDEQGFDEAPHAKAVARHLGTDHTELYVEAQQALDLIPKLASIYDEPFADSSQLPTSLVSAMTRESVTVSLSGDGGDELFGGYARYIDASRLWSRLARYPQPLRSALSALVGQLVPPTRRVTARLSGNAMQKLTALLLRAEQLAPLVGRHSEEDIFRHLLTHWSGQRLLRGQPPIHDQVPRYPDLGSPLQNMQFDDMTRYLPDTILTKVDRASMAVSLESRAPLLDHDLVEFAWQLPDKVRIRDGQGKWLMRQVLDRHVPHALTDRPKMGFAVPVAAWLRGPLIDWAEDLLDPSRLAAQGWFDVKLVRRVWDEHRTGEWDHYHDLWAVLMFQSWLAQYHD